jgi:hypothetical protein
MIVKANGHINLEINYLSIYLSTADHIMETPRVLGHSGKTLISDRNNMKC